MEMSTLNSWSEMSSDAVELILAKLPERSVLRAASVCKGWNDVVRDASFIEFYKQKQTLFNTGSPYHFTLEGMKYCLKKQNGDFCVEIANEDDDCSYDLPTIPCPSQKGERIPCLKGGGGIFYALIDIDDQRQVLKYKFSPLEQHWKSTPELLYKMHDTMPIVGVVKDAGTGAHTIVCAGHIDDNDGGLVVQIYDCVSGFWKVGEVLPYEFRDSSHTFTTSVVHGEKIFAYDNFMGFVSELDISTKQWSKVKMVWLSSKVQRSCLFSEARGLCLAAIEGANDTDLRCNVWSMDESSLQRKELLHSQLIVNARPASVPAFFRRRLSMCLDGLSMAVFLFLLLVVQFFMYSHGILKRVGRVFQVTLTSGIRFVTCLNATIRERVQANSRCVAKLVSQTDVH